MPVQININGADAAEALKELSSLAAGFGGTAPTPAAQGAKQEEAPKRQRAARADSKQTKEEPPQEPAKDAEQGTPIELSDEDLGFDEEEVPTDVQLRATASEKAKSAGREKVKALLNKYSVPNVTAVPNNKRSAFLKELEALA